MRVREILMRVKKILAYFRKNTADNLTFNVEFVNADLEAVVDKLVEVQEVRNLPAERPRVGARRRRSPAGRCRGSAYVRRRRERAR